MSGPSEQKREEQNLFEAFRKACPGFSCGEYYLPEHDPPDVIYVDASGRRIGIEICQWAHQGEMKAGRLRERIVQNMRDAIGEPQPVNTSKNFSLVVFFPKSKVHLTRDEYPILRESLLQLITHVDEEWVSRRPGQYYRFKEMNCFPPLKKCLELVGFRQRSLEDDSTMRAALTSDSHVDWIVPVGRFDSFDDSTMLVPLQELLRKKQARCRALKTHCDELHLVIAYDQALPYCSPITTPRRSVEDIAREAAAELSMDRGPFSCVFLLVADEPCRVHRLL